MPERNWKTHLYAIGENFNLAQHPERARRIGCVMTLANIIVLVRSYDSFEGSLASALGMVAGWSLANISHEWIKERSESK